MKSDTVFCNKYPSVSKIPVIRGLVYWMYIDGLWYSVGLLLISFIFLGFGLYRLGKHFTSDEITFLTKIPDFYKGILEGDWAKTYVIDKPAVITCILSGIPELIISHWEYSPAEFEKYLFLWRLPTVLFNFFSLFIICSFLKKLTNKNYALLTTGLIAFTPVIIGMTQIVNADATLWNTNFLAILALFLYFANNQKKYIIYSGIFLGLACLSKYNAQLLYIVFILFLYLEYLFRRFNRKQFSQKLVGLCLIYLISVAVFCILWPYSWLNIGIAWYKTVYIAFTNIPFVVFVVITVVEAIFLKGRFSQFIISKINIRKWFIIFFNSLVLSLVLTLVLTVLYYYTINTEFIPLLKYGGQQWEEPFIPTFLGNMNSIVLGTNVPTLVAILLFLSISLFKKGRIKIGENLNILIYLILYVILFNLGAAVKGVRVSGRYQITLFPCLSLITAIIYINFTSRTKLITLTLLIVSLIDLILLMPNNYLTYNNKLYFNYSGLGYSGPRLTWGFGGYEVAQKANTLQNARSLKVLSDYEGFSVFFIGRNKRVKKRMTNEYIKQFDYLCLSSVAKPCIESWMGMTYSALQYYNQPVDSAIFHIGDEKCGYVKLVKVDKEKMDKKIPYTFDPDLYLELSKPFSISFWINSPLKNPGNPIYLNDDYTNGISIESFSNEGKGELRFRYEKAVTESTTASTGYIFDNKWHHVVWYQTGGKKGSEFGLYVDSVKQKPHSLSNDKTKVVKFFISQMFKGQLQDFRIYNFPLSQAQVDALYAKKDVQVAKLPLSYIKGLEKERSGRRKRAVSQMKSRVKTIMRGKYEIPLYYQVKNQP